MNKILIISTHPPYDYRIYRHIKMLTKHYYDITYINIVNPNNKFSKESPVCGIKYVQIQFAKKFSVKNMISLSKLFSHLNFTRWDVIFIQDPKLIFFPFLFMKKNLYLDIHENQDLRDKLDGKALTFYLRKRKSVIFSPYKCVLDEFHNCVSFHIDNRPLKEDFSVAEYSRNLIPTVIYVGMITNQFRQMNKLFDVFEILLQRQINVVLIGKVSNMNIDKNLMEKINYLSTYNNFEYLGFQNRVEVIKQLYKSHFSISLMDLKENVSISPNKLYESLATGNIIITDHLNIDSLSLMDFDIISLNKTDTPQIVAESILQNINNELVHRCEQQTQNFDSKQLYWENYDPIYENFLNLNNTKKLK